jgi:hypothetical protein
MTFTIPFRFAFLLLLVPQLFAASIEYYLPNVGSYDASIPKPAETLGFQVGEWHARPEQIQIYMERLAEASDRMTLEQIGLSHQRRPILQAIFTSPENHGMLEQLRREHLRWVLEGKSERSAADMPAILYLGYNVHGNEASAAHASLLAAYFLTAAPEAAEILKKTIVIMDPVMNPDGLANFSQWVNMFRGSVPVGDPHSIEHGQNWPPGRTNHYMFDLNRDWLLLVHPESRARVRSYQRWLPTVLCDFHEMGTAQTYFFQPGIQSRTHPLTPQQNQELTAKIAQYHAKAFDQAGELYFTEEIFDDFYYGKGSTYPDSQGTIGILFEQASARGHIQDRVNLPPQTFAHAIRNQLKATLSTLEAVVGEREALLTYQGNFTRQALELAKNDPIRAYVVGDDGDPARANAMLDILLQHRIEVHRLARTVEAANTRITSGFVVRTDQHKYRLLKSLFQKTTEFRDNTFYDVSTWHFPSAFDLPYLGLDGRTFNPNVIGDRIQSVTQLPAIQNLASDVPAYVIPWDQYYAPAAAHRLLQRGIYVRASAKAFTVTTAAGNFDAPPGSLVIGRAEQKDPSALANVVLDVANQTKVPVWAATTGLTPKGIDLGSSSFAPLGLPKIALVAGRGMRTYDVGSVWHHLDKRLGIPVTLLPKARLKAGQLDDYTHVILTSSTLPKLDQEARTLVNHWLQRGGTFIALKGGMKYLQAQNIWDFKYASENDDRDKPAETVGSFSERRRARALDSLNGTILKIKVDQSHPLAFGLKRDHIAVHRNHTWFVETKNNTIENVGVYDSEPLISGYAATRNLDLAKATAALMVTRKGKGNLIGIVDDATFRGYWYGTSRFVTNAIFLSSLMN